MACSVNVAIGQGGLQVCDAVLSVARRAESTRSTRSTRSRKKRARKKDGAAPPAPPEFPLGSSRRALFRRHGEVAGVAARTVFADTEPRVVHEFLSDPRRDWVTSKNTICEHAGRGNNWAEGYLGSVEFVAKTMEALRREVEACDWFRSAYMYHSLGGGTGSGSGSRVLQEMRDAYPRCCLGSVAIAPSASCESPIFTYNTMLSLWQLQQHADAIMLFTNDDLEARAAQSLQFLTNKDHTKRGTSSSPSTSGGGSAGTGSIRGSDTPSYTRANNNKNDGSLSALAGTAKGLGMAQRDMTFALEDLNTQAALAMCGLVYPMEAPPSSLVGVSGGISSIRSQGLADVVAEVAPVCDLKYVDVRSSYFCLPSETAWRHRAVQGPATGDSWARAAKLLMRRTPRFDDENKPIVTLSSQMLLRGSSRGTHAPWSPKIVNRLVAYGNPAPWNFPGDTSVRRSTVDALGTRSITCVANRSHVAAILRRLHNKAGAMYSAGAWVHWYEQAGLDEGDWLESFANAQKVVQAYSAAAQPGARGLN
jgi:hypothetical protein